MVRKKMEGNEEQRREKAREARERGSSPSAEGETTGASKQRHKVESTEGHDERLEAKKRGKQESVRQKAPESTTGYRDTPEKSGRGSRSGD